MERKWRRCRDCAAGQDAVHAASQFTQPGALAGVIQGAQQNYLPMLKQQKAEDYAAYVMRALFFNATWRTIAGLVGMLFRKPPMIDVPESIKHLLDDVTMSGVPLHVFLQQVSEECITVGRAGVFVDYPTAPAYGTMADAEALNLRPSINIYKAEKIINWRIGRVNNRCVVTRVVLTEDHAEQDPKDEFNEIFETRYRVLDLVDGIYRVRIFKVNLRGDDEQVGGDVFPLMNGSPLSYIPFSFLGVDDITPSVDEPPLIDLVDVNLSHYRTTADYEHGCHWTGLAQPWIAGYQKEDGEELSTGGGTAWIFSDSNASAGMLSLDHDFVALSANLNRKEQQMAVLGARMLSSDKKAAEAADTAAIHRSGENSVLAGIAQTISLGCTPALKTFCEWAGADGDVKIEINRDFFPVSITPDMLKALLAGWQAGAPGFSDQSFFDNLKQSEIVPQELTLDEEKTRIDVAAPVLRGPAMPLDNQNQKVGAVK